MSSHTKVQDKGNINFTGFTNPTTTSVPDQVFDELLPDLTGAELKVLLYICRRTFGFKKKSDTISLKQMVHGIRTKEGKVLDHGTGLAKSTVANTLTKLEELNVIIRQRNTNYLNGDQPTTYSLNLNPPVSENDTRGVSSSGQGVSSQRDTQHTGKQITDKQQRAATAKLLQHGVSKRVASRLAQNYDASRLSEKIEFLEYLVKHKPGKIKSPHGWLRSAIEEDYDPPEGYRPAREREKDKQENAQRDATLKQRNADLVKLQKIDAEKRRLEQTKALSELQNRYETSQVEIDLWEDILEELRENGSGMAYGTAKSVHLLTIQNETAIFATANSFIVDRIRESFGDLLLEMFQQRGYNVHEMTAVILGDATS